METVKGFEGVYSVTRDGRIWSHKTRRFLKYWKIGRGYAEVSLCSLPQNKKYLVHRLVAQAYIKNPESKEQVNHKNGNRLDNRVENLEWCTNQENRNHAIRTGLVNVRGENSPNAIFSNEDILDIRDRFSKGESQSSIGKIYKARGGTIWSIVRRKCWKHL